MCLPTQSGFRLIICSTDKSARGSCLIFGFFRSRHFRRIRYHDLDKRADADNAKVLTIDEARRMASNIAKLTGPPIHTEWTKVVSLQRRTRCVKRLLYAPPRLNALSISYTYKSAT
jgi:hypothetical protein